MRLSQNQTVFVDGNARWVHATVEHDVAERRLAVSTRPAGEMGWVEVFQVTDVEAESVTKQGEVTYRGLVDGDPVTVVTRPSKGGCGCGSDALFLFVTPPGCVSAGYLIEDQPTPPPAGTGDRLVVPDTGTPVSARCPVPWRIGFGFRSRRSSVLDGFVCAVSLVARPFGGEHGRRADPPPD